MENDIVAKAAAADTGTVRIFSSLALTGALIGLGQLLASREELTPRIIIGRALSSAGLGAAAAGVLAFFPGLPLVAQLGIAATLASLGTSALEKLVQRLFGVR